MKTIKFRAWDGEEMYYFDLGEVSVDWYKHKLMQYIGLTDENGKEIYEGDILNSTDKCYCDFDKYIVEDLRSFFESKGYAERELAEEWERSKVIGNIYENPEILRKK